MKSFLKLVFANIVGTILAGIVLIIIFFAIVAGFASMFEKNAEPVLSNTLLKLTIPSDLGDYGQGEELDFTGGRISNKLGLVDYVAALKAAKNDNNINGLLINMNFTNLGYATIQELGLAIQDFKQSGKRIYAHGDMVSQRNYLLASHADEIYMTPGGSVEFTGFGTQTLFFKRALEKLGIKFNIIYEGKFKSFTEPYRKTQMSAENKEQIRLILSGYNNQYASTLLNNRRINADALNGIFNKLSVSSSEEAVQFGLVDSIMFYNDFLEHFAKQQNLKSVEDLHILSVNKYYQARNIKGKDGYTSAPKIAVLFMEGEISDGQLGNQGIIGNQMAKKIRNIRIDSSYKALVIRVNSPGGSALASDIIHHEIERTKQRIPVIVSMGNVAASGGYMISAGANKIYAHETTITGSIGVFAMWPEISELVSQKLGVDYDTVRIHSHADFGNILRPLSQEETELFKERIAKVYLDFITMVAEGRGLTLEQVDEIAQGRVWTGSDALKIGLVDELGGLKEAIQHAQQITGLTEKDLDYFPKKKKFMDNLLQNFDNSNTKAFIEIMENPQFKLKQLTNETSIYARIPFDLEN